MMSETRTKNLQRELTAMCELLARGTTIEELCKKTKASVTTVRARKVILVRAGVRIASEATSRGWNTKVYRLEDSLSQAKIKVRVRYEPMSQAKAAKRKAAPREGPGKSGREMGWGIESWFFMTSDRSVAYVEWCEPWTTGEKRRECRDE